MRQSEDEALLPIWRMQSSLIIFNLLIWPAALAAAWGFTRQVVRPIGQLTAATRRIAAGELDVPMESARRDEIGQLARSFEDMRVQLQRSRQQLTQRAADLEVKTNELSALFEVSQQLASTLQMDTVLSSAIKAIRSLFPAADAGAVFLYRPEEGRLVAETCFGLDQAEAGPVSLAPGEGCAGQAFAGQRPVLREAGKRKPVTSGAGEDGPEGWSRLLADGTGLAVPLAAEGQVLGSIALYTHRRRALSLAQAPLLESLAAQATLAILNARLFQEASLAGAWQELNRLKTEFVARASHQLRTPLTVIKSFAETLLRRDVRLSASERREFLEGIDRAADRLTRLVEDLLTITRIESGRLEMRVGPVSLPAIVERVVGGYRQNTSCRLTVVVSPRMPLALADPDRVEDVLSNLISNAVKYSSPDGTITIELAPAQAGSLPASGRVPAARANAGGLVLMSVTDTGIGISAADQGRLFQPFSRIDNPVTRRIAGAGLGLYICKTYVEAMGGTIWVESEPEKRTAFRVCLPAAETADLAAGVSAAPDADRLPARRSNGLSGRRILVVDDEPDVLKAVRSSLRASGLQVLQADTAEQCFFVLETERPDLILLDVVLPDGDGFAIARSLRADPTTRQIPVVFVTARATAADEEQGRQAGAVAYLRKPFSTADLLRVVQEALSDTDSRRAGDETAGRAVESTTGQGAYPRARG